MFYKCTFVLQSSYGSTLLSWLTCCQLILTITSVVFWTISSKDEILSLPLVNSSNLYRRTGHPFLSRWLGITRKSFLEAYLYKQYSIDIIQYLSMQSFFIYSFDLSILKEKTSANAFTSPIRTWRSTMLMLPLSATPETRKKI